MRMILTARIPHHTFNAAMKDGTAVKKLNDIIGSCQPEATYMMSLDGLRTVVLIVDLPDPSQLPSLCEPWFLGFEADVEIQPVATPEDFAKADFDGIASRWT